MNELKIFKLSDKMYINLYAISHFEIVDDPNNADKYAILYLLRTQNGDRIYLNKTQAISLMMKLVEFQI